MEKAAALIVVSGGVAEAVAPEHVDVRIIDCDNIEAGDELEELPRGVGFEHLVEQAELRVGRDFNWEGEKPARLKGMEAIEAIIEAYESALTQHIYDEGTGESVPDEEYAIIADARLALSTMRNSD